jgi:hypothetical protein
VNYTSVDPPLCNSTTDDEDDEDQGTYHDLSENDDHLSSSPSQISSLSQPLSTPSISTPIHRLGGYSSYSLTTNSTSRSDNQFSTMSTPPPLSPNITFASKNLQKAVRATLLSTSLSPIPPEQWETEHVADWLTQLGFGSVVDQFIGKKKRSAGIHASLPLFSNSDMSEQEITGDVLLELSLQSLKELDIDTYGKRFKIHSSILALREEIFRQDPFYLHPTKSCLITTEVRKAPLPQIPLGELHSHSLFAPPSSN